MKKISKTYLLNNKEFFLSEMIKGKIFVYPTDTIYGIGGIATLDRTVKKIRDIKSRDSKPFSIIAPSKKWINDNFSIEENNIYLDKLPGPYTLILNYRNLDKENNNNIVSKETAKSLTSLGVRIPNHWISDLIQELNIPFITTSLNISGEPPYKKLNNLDKKIEEKVDYIIDEGELNSNPSTIIDLRDNNIKEIKRNK